MRKISAEELRGFPVAGPRNSELATELYGLFDKDSDLLGIVLQDKHDGDFSFVVLTRKGQPQNQYAAIDLGVSYPRNELAESSLKAAMERIHLNRLAEEGPGNPNPQKPDEGEEAGVKLDMLTCRDCKSETFEVGIASTDAPCTECGRYLMSRCVSCGVVACLVCAEQKVLFLRKQRNSSLLAPLVSPDQPRSGKN